MTNPSIVLLATLLLAVLFAVVFLVLRRRPFFGARPFIKAAMAVLLAVYCLQAEPPLLLMAAGFGLSALGDYFLDLHPLDLQPKSISKSAHGDKFFLPGLIAFFAAHVAFAAYLFGHMVPLSMFTPVEWGISAVMIALTIGFYLWLKSGLPGDMKIPVAAYSAVITIMGITALTTTLPSLLVPIGAILFIASDVVLAVERFKFKFPLDKQINWTLYASGQILLAIGVVGSLV